MITVVPYSEKYKSHIKDLNYEWPEKYFFVEPDDITQLSDPEGEILNKGGYIWYLLVKEEVAGTISLLKINDEEYELAKMAITEKHKSKGFGKLLMEHCINEAVKLKGKKTNSLFEQKTCTGYLFVNMVLKKSHPILMFITSVPM